MADLQEALTEARDAMIGIEECVRGLNGVADLVEDGNRDLACLLQALARLIATNALEVEGHLDIAREALSADT